MGGIMTKTNNRLWYDTGKTKIAIDLHTTPNDFYSNDGLPIKLKNGDVVYAPYVSSNDVNRTPIKVQKVDGSTKVIGSTTVNASQQYDFTNTVEINLSGNSTKQVEYNTFVFNMPYTGKIHLLSKFFGGQTGWGYSGDSWQYADFFLDLDGQQIHQVRYRRSQGINLKTFFNGYLTVDGGLHTLRLRILGKCSNKDSHLTKCTAWYNTLTLEGYDEYVYEKNGTFTPPEDFKGKARVTCYGGGGASTALTLQRKFGLFDLGTELKGYVSCNGSDGEVVAQVVDIEQKSYPIIIGNAGSNPSPTNYTYKASDLGSMPAGVPIYSSVGTNGGATTALGVTANGGKAAGSVSVVRDSGENFTYKTSTTPTKTEANNGGTAALVDVTWTDDEGEEHKTKQMQLSAPRNGKVVIQLIKEV